MANITKTIVVFKSEPKKIVAILEQHLEAMFHPSPALDIVHTELHWGYVSDNEVGRFDYMNTADGRVMLLAKPDHLSIAEAYDYIIAHLNR